MAREGRGKERITSLKERERGIVEGNREVTTCLPTSGYKYVSHTENTLTTCERVRE